MRAWSLGRRTVGSRLVEYQALSGALPQLKLLFHTYNLLLNSVVYGTYLYLRPKEGEDADFAEGRMGRYSPEAKKDGGCPRVWFHAASVGEVTGILPTLAALRKRLPRAAIYLTVGTLHGYRFARSKVASDALVLPFPLDFPWALKRAFRALRPQLYATVESELWPNLFHFLRLYRVPALLLNGHLSDRSVRRYDLLRPLFGPIFQQFHRLAMHSPEDRENAVRLGAAPERTIVLGTAKYDGLAMRVRPEKLPEWRALLDISPTTPVVVGGSLRKSECREVPEAFAALLARRPDIVGIFAPRHMERVQDLVEWLTNRSIPFQFLTRIERTGERRRAPVVIVDRIGALFELYALGDFIFCGGTLEPIGGHNILEPAAWAKPVFYGPHVEKVQREHALLQTCGGSFMVPDGKELQRQWIYWLEHPDELKERGLRAGEAVRSLEGVAARQVELILKTLEETEASRSTSACRHQQRTAYENVRELDKNVLS